MFDYRSMRHTGQSIAEGKRHSVMFGALEALSLPDEQGQIDIKALNLGHMGHKIVRVQSTGHEVALTEDDHATLILPRRGQLASRLGGNSWRAMPKNAVLFGPSRRATRVSGPFDALALVLPHRHLVDGLAGRIGLPDATAIQGDTPGLGRVQQLMADILGLAAEGPALFPSAQMVKGLEVLVHEALLDMVLAHGETDQPSRQPRSQRHRVLLAEEVMRSRTSEPLSMADIARDLDISLRSLQLAFQQVRRMGPRDALNRIRLQTARQLLLRARPGQTVTAIALDCGVSHVSRFAAVYRLAYGEYPAETLAEAMRRAG